MTPTVYIIQDSPGKNFLPAQEYGTLRILLSNRDANLNPNFLIEILDERLSSVTSDDYLILVGHPIAIGLCVHIVLNKIDKIHVLVWDKVRYSYKEYTLENQDDRT